MTIVVCRIVAPVPIECEPEVADLKVAGSRDQEVVRFDIAVDTFQCMGRLDTHDHLGNVESCHRLMERVLADQQTKEVTARHVLHHQVQVGSILEAGYQWHNPGTCALAI